MPRDELFVAGSFIARCNHNGPWTKSDATSLDINWYPDLNHQVASAYKIRLSRLFLRRHSFHEAYPAPVFEDTSAAFKEDWKVI